jgi:hypothetical protein
MTPRADPIYAAIEAAKRAEAAFNDLFETDADSRACKLALRRSNKAELAAMTIAPTTDGGALALIDFSLKLLDGSGGDMSRKGGNYMRDLCESLRGFLSVRRPRTLAVSRT